MSDRTQLDTTTATEVPGSGRTLRDKYASNGALLGGAGALAMIGLADTFAYASSLVTGGVLVKTAIGLTTLFAGVNFVLTCVGMLGAFAALAAGIFVGVRALFDKDFRNKLGTAQSITYGVAALTVGCALSGLGGPYALAIVANAFNGSVAGRMYARWTHKPAVLAS